MKDITLGDIATLIAFIVALIGGVEFLMARFKKVFDMQIKTYLVMMHIYQ